MKKHRFIGTLLAGVMAFSGVSALPSLSETLIADASAASKLAAPANITAKVTNSSTVTLSWDKVNGASMYRVYMYDTLNEKYVKYCDVAETSAQVGGLKAGRTYKFKIAALKGSGTSYKVQTKSKVIKASPKLEAPSYIKAAVGETTATISWYSVSGADAYRVYKYDSTKKKYVKYKNVTDTSCKISGLTVGKSYKFKVAALVEYGGSYNVQTLSDAIDVTPNKPEPVALPKIPTFGSKGVDAVKMISPGTYSYTSNEMGGVYTCDTGSNSMDNYSMYMLLTNKNDEVYAVLYTVFGENTDVSSLLKSIEASKGKGIKYSDEYSDSYIWDDGKTIDIYVASTHSSYNSAMYEEIDKAYAPNELMESYNKWLKEMNSGNTSSSGSSITGILG